MPSLRATHSAACNGDGVPSQSIARTSFCWRSGLVPTRMRMRTTPLLAAMFGLVFAGCEQEPQGWHRHGAAVAKPAAVEVELKIEVPPPPFSDGAFPCSECHDPTIPVNTKRREMKMAHEEIVLHHDEEQRWCFDCHAVTNRDKLRLASGEEIDFSESYRLCGQCHGDKYRDWRAGVHGRLSGEWNGKKTYLLCVHCHASHEPAFKPLRPEAMPRRPGGKKS